ncbi:hypothetical protein [Natrialba swarupiae]|uniref:Uncharacterized protein n=1 Tax=Natrialba swarupiae TaxID=2448032 RepID=A0A5D5AIP1_9EURY|nr:hypothetical protein [Natrialba swarupiae]TYT60793.1 hypothetical protein FYC77_17160 [Natrialba swarupiae]
MDSSTDFVELASRIHTQSCDAAGSDTERVTIRSLESVDPDSLSTLLEVAENDGAAPSDLVFVLSRTNVDHLTERASEIDDPEAIACGILGANP